MTSRLCTRLLKRNSPVRHDEYVTLRYTPCGEDKEKYRDKGLTSRSRVRLFVALIGKDTRVHGKGWAELNTPAGRSVSAWNVRGESVRGVLIEIGDEFRGCCLFVRVCWRSFCDVDEVVVSMWMLLSAEIMRCLSARGWVFRVSLSDDCKVFGDCIYDFYSSCWWLDVSVPMIVREFE